MYVCVCVLPCSEYETRLCQKYVAMTNSYN